METTFSSVQAVDTDTSTVISAHMRVDIKSLMKALASIQVEPKAVHFCPRRSTTITRRLQRRGAYHLRDYEGGSGERDLLHSRADCGGVRRASPLYHNAHLCSVCCLTSSGESTKSVLPVILQKKCRKSTSSSAATRPWSSSPREMTKGRRSI